MKPTLALAIAARAAVMLLLFAGCAAAQTYPTKPIRLVLPVTPGGGTDALARIIGPKLAEGLGQSVVVDNRPGAGGNISMETVTKAAPDGYTLWFGVGFRLVVNPMIYKLAFDPIRDFAPIMQLATAQFILVLHPSVPAKSVAELVALAKAKPGSLNYASSGAGSTLHLAAELFKSRARIDMVHVAYKGGAPAATAVLVGEAQVIFGSVTASLPHVKAGRLRALATTGVKRSKVAPELPTIAESGFPGFDVRSWYAFMAPAGTPAAVVNRIHDEAIKVLQLADVQRVMSRQGLEVETSTPQELAGRIKAESAMWARVIKEAGIRAE